MEIITGQAQQADRKRGPVATPGRVRVTVYLDAALADWGKRQDGGLSDLMRRLLASARSNGGDATVTEPSAYAAPSAYPSELRGAYDRLITAKLRSGLSPDEEAELADVRAQINAEDRRGSAWELRERAALAVDEAIGDLRQAIEALPPKSPHP